MITLSEVVDLKTGGTVYTNATLCDDGSGSVTLGQGSSPKETVSFETLEEGFAKLEVMKQYLAALVFIKSGLVEQKAG